MSSASIPRFPNRSLANAPEPLVSWWVRRNDSSGALEVGDPTSAAPRRSLGMRAELASLDARAKAHERQSEFELAAGCWAELARAHLARKSRYDLAIQCARRSLELKEDFALREELAGWLEGIGDFEHAAELFSMGGEPRSDADRLRLYRRVVSLYWRSGQTEKAAHALAEIARIDSDGTEPLESLAALHSGAHEVVSRERAVLAQLEAARRYQQQGSRLMAFEAELRAFEIDPGSLSAAEQLANTLTKLGRQEAADDVWRECAHASDDRSIPRRQVEKALNRDEPERAFAASLDALDDTLLDMGAALRACEFALNPSGLAPNTFEGILVRTRAFGWLAARLDIAIAEGRALTSCAPHIVLTRLFASLMGHSDWAIDSLNQALLVEPRAAEPRRMLEASMADADASNDLLRALVNSARVACSTESQLWLANEFIERHRRGSSEPSLLVWALRTKRRESLAGSVPPNALAEWQSRKSEEQLDWQNRLREMHELADFEKVAELEHLASRMVLDPEAFENLRNVYVEWITLAVKAPAAEEQLARLVDALASRGTVDEPGQDWRAAFTILTRAGSERGCLSVARYWLRQANPAEALAVLRPLLEKPEPNQRLVGWIVTLARRLVDKRLYAEAIVAISKTTEAGVGVALLAHAAEVYMELEDRDSAQRIVDTALAASANSARLSMIEVNLLNREDPQRVAETLERALGVIPPRAQLALQLAQSHESLGNAELALAWALRASALRPGSLELHEHVARLAIWAKDAARLTDWLVHVIEVPLIATEWLPTAARVLQALTEIDAPRAAEATRRLVVAVGAAQPDWRKSVLACADSVADARLAIDILERAVARQPDLADALKDVVRRSLKLGDIEAAFSTSLRALKAGAAPTSIRKWLPHLEINAFEVPGTELAAAELSWELSQIEERTDLIIKSGRRLALDRYRLANDETAAFSLWFELLKLEHAEVIEWVAEDLALCIGHRPAVNYLQKAAKELSLHPAKARLHAAAAQLSAQMGDHDVARELVGLAIAADPANTRALFIAESLANSDSHYRWLDELYDAVARSTLGSYGERAIHYRAAKVLQSRGCAFLALPHACGALVAVPSESTTLQLAASLSREVGDARQFVDAVLSVVKRSPSAQQSARWLDLAQRQLENESRFLKCRLELMLHLLTIEPTAALVDEVTEVTSQLGIQASSGFRQQLPIALRENLKKIEGPSGARLALAIGRAAARLNEVDLCALSLSAAFGCDAAIDEYDGTEWVISWLGAEPGVAKRLLLEVLDVLEQPYTNVGMAALRSLSYLQLCAGDALSFTRLEAMAQRMREGETYLEWIAELVQKPSANWGCGGSVVGLLVAGYLQRQHTESALALLRYGVTVQPRTRIAFDFAMQAVALLLKNGDLTGAQQWLQSIRECLTPVNASTIELELARMTGETLHLVQALAHRAYSDPSAPAEGVEYLVEATALAERLGHRQAALDCARAAIKWDPKHNGAQLALAALLYKVERHEGNTPGDDSQVSLEQLMSVVAERAEDEELRAFLVAEGLDRAQGLGPGLAELRRAQMRVGDRPLVCLGIAERLNLPGDAEQAFSLFEHAMSGDLRGLRSIAEVCLGAARLALRHGLVDVAERWLSKALAQQGCPPEAANLLNDLRQDTGDSPDERSLRADEQRAELEPNLLVAPSEAKLEPEPVGPPNSGITADDDGVEIPLIRRRSEQPSEAPTATANIDQALISPETDPGSVVEAVERAGFMVKHASASYQTLTLLRRWLRRWPSSVQLMEFVRDAAYVERDIALSQAIEHVRCVLLGASISTEPPDLGSQPIVPEAVRALLSRDVSSAASEALGLVWEGGERLLQRDLTDYGVTGLDRVNPNAATPLAQILGEVSTRFGLLRTPLFHRRGAQRARASLVLASPTAILVEGELPRETSELAALIAAPLWATQPEYSIVLGASAQQAKTILIALQLAFGPPQRHPSTNHGEVLRLAEKLWESIPSAAQRRLRDLCMESLDYDRALKLARRAEYRAGLYATGDFRWALDTLSKHSQRDILSTVSDADVGESDPDLADLLRLATSAEYAAVRWQPSKGSERRMPIYPR